MITGYAYIIWAEILDQKMVTDIQLKDNELKSIQAATRKIDLCLDVHERTNYSC